MKTENKRYFYVWCITPAQNAANGDWGWGMVYGVGGGGGGGGPTFGSARLGTSLLYSSGEYAG